MKTLDDLIEIALESKSSLSDSEKADNFFKYVIRQLDCNSSKLEHYHFPDVELAKIYDLYRYFYNSNDLFENKDYQESYEKHKYQIATKLLELDKVLFKSVKEKVNLVHELQKTVEALLNVTKATQTIESHLIAQKVLVLFPDIDVNKVPSHRLEFLYDTFWEYVQKEGITYQEAIEEYQEFVESLNKQYGVI